MDINAVVWLENYLTNWDRTLLVVSHNRDFLNNVTQQTIHFVNKQLTYYKGNYDNFESVRCHPSSTHPSCIVSCLLPSRVPCLLEL